MSNPIHNTTTPFGPAAGDLAQYARESKKRKPKKTEITKEVIPLIRQKSPPAHPLTDRVSLTSTPPSTPPKQGKKRVRFSKLDSPNSPPHIPSLATPPSTPPRPQRLTIIPPTPGKSMRTRQEDKPPLFDTQLPSSDANLIDYFSEIEELPIPSYTRISSYQMPGHPKRVIIEQGSSKDCGGAAALMLLSDVKALYFDQVKLNKEFMEWSARAYLYNGEQLLKGLSKAVANASILQREKIPTENPLSSIEEKLQLTGLPVITSISHERIGGHWIMVDHISDEDVFIRDPNTGKAYRVPKTEMEKSYKDEDLKEDIIFISQSSD